ncbi:MAG TPA: hypothetical protein VG435_11055 [Acidimicrobiales bacterium]|nr:hypothetical protein [Acidimicrobiales bacterium]
MRTSDPAARTDTGATTPVAPTGAVTPSAAAPAATGQETGAVTPGAVQPQAVKSRPVAKKAPSTREIQPGDKVCAQCGEGNDPARNFCRRCGSSLVEAVVFGLPWYKRLFRRLFGRKQHQAGARPKGRRRAFGGSAPGWLSTFLKIVVIIAIAVVALLSFVGPWHKSLKTRETRYYHDVEGLVHPTYSSVFAEAASSTSNATGHPAQNLIDGALNTSWQSKGTVTGQRLEVFFGQPSSIAKIGFDSGDQDTNSVFQSEPRPKELKLVFTGGKNPGSQTITLADQPKFQTFSVHSKGATGVLIYIESVYPATGFGKNVSVAQIEFYTKN